MFDNSLACVIVNKNDAKYLIKRLESVKGQTRPFDEIILIDDGSTDNSVEVMENFTKSYAESKIIIKSYKDNKGCNARINNILSQIKSCYSFFGASDDFFTPDFVEKFKYAYEDMPQFRLCTSIPGSYKDEKITHNNFRIPGRCFISHIDVITYIIHCGFWIAGHCTILHTKTVLKFNGFQEHFKWHSDMFLNYVIAMTYGLVFIPVVLGIKICKEQSEAGYSTGYYSKEQTYVKQLMLQELQKKEYNLAQKPLSYFINGLRG